MRRRGGAAFRSLLSTLGFQKAKACAAVAALPQRFPTTRDCPGTFENPAAQTRTSLACAKPGAWKRSPRTVPAAIEVD